MKKKRIILDTIQINYFNEILGPKNFYADAKMATPVFLNVEKGKEYFIRVDLTTIAMVGNPKLTLIENRIGMKEYREMH